MGLVEAEIMQGLQRRAEIERAKNRSPVNDYHRLHTAERVQANTLRILLMLRVVGAEISVLRYLPTSAAVP